MGLEVELGRMRKEGVLVETRLGLSFTPPERGSTGEGTVQSKSRFGLDVGWGLGGMNFTSVSAKTSGEHAEQTGEGARERCRAGTN